VTDDDDSLDRWRRIEAAQALVALADYAKQDLDFAPLKDSRTTRWHASVGGRDFELLCTGPKFHDTRAGLGGGGAIDMAMHLLHLRFKQAAALLRQKKL
jgi:hypothetical protein